MNKPRFQHLAFTALSGDTIDEEERLVEGWASTTLRNAYGAVTHPEALAESFGEFLSNPGKGGGPGGLFLWSHDTQELPLGWVRALEVVPDKGLRAVFQFARTPNATEKWEAYKEGLWRGLSLGFDGDYTDDYGYHDEETDTWHWTQNCQLLEISGCCLPADPGAMFTYARSLGLEESAPQPFPELPLAPLETAWYPRQAEASVRAWAGEDWTRYGRAFCWQAPRAHRPADFRLPVAQVNEQGELEAVWEACAVAMSTLLGARGGADIPEAERERVYRHLTAYYQRFEKSPPEFHGEAALKDVAFLSGELDILEQVLARETADKLQSNAHSLACIAAHWRKQGGDLSADLRDAAASSIAELEQMLQATPEEAPAPTSSRMDPQLWVLLNT